MNHWAEYPVPAQRHEALYGDRIVRCFADRPTSFHALFEAARRAHPEADAMVFEGRRWRYDETGAEARYSIVGLDETDPARGRISWISPLARALLKARNGDSVRFPAPGGVRELEIIDIEYTTLD